MSESLPKQNPADIEGFVAQLKRLSDNFGTGEAKDNKSLFTVSAFSKLVPGGSDKITVSHDTATGRVDTVYSIDPRTGTVKKFTIDRDQKEIRSDADMVNEDGSIDVKEVDRQTNEEAFESHLADEEGIELSQSELAGFVNYLNGL